MSKQAYERKLSQIEELRSVPVEQAVPALRRVFKDRSNYLVAKAAAVVGDRQIQELIPDLLAAFDRMMKDPVSTDKQCWAKTAIAKALKDLEHHEADIFLRGIAHRQLEPTWTRPVDTAATLRGICAIALTNCKHLQPLQILSSLTDLLADEETPVRIDAARAIAHLGAMEGLLPLRLKARLGDSEPEVIGHCFAALLNLAPSESLKFVAGFLHSEDADIRIEAAAALADSRQVEALVPVKEFLSRQSDPEVHRTVLAVLGTSPQPATGDYLLSVVESASERIGCFALAALGKSRYAGALRENARRVIAARESAVLTAAFEKAFGSSSADSPG